MISKSEYEVLTILSQGPEIDEEKYFDELQTLLSEKLIRHNVTGQTFNAIKYHGFLITPKGQRAFEEYKNFLENQILESEAIKLAEESNKIAKESNNIANCANKKSHNANVLSLIAIVIPSFLSIGALIVSILAYFKN